MNVGDKIVYIGAWRYLPAGKRGTVLEFVHDDKFVLAHFGSYGIKTVKLTNIRPVSALEQLAEGALP